MGNLTSKSKSSHECYHQLEKELVRKEIGSSCWIKTPENITSHQLSTEECLDYCENDPRCIGTFTNNPVFTTFRREHLAVVHPKNKPSWASSGTKLDCFNLMVNGYGNGIL
jgi:hypothetical protein